MGDWSGWYRCIKTTGPGRQYLYLQRARRVPGEPYPKTQPRSLGRYNGNPVPRKRTRFDAASYGEVAHVNVGGVDIGEVLQKADEARKTLRRKTNQGIGLALFGDRNDYDLPHDSVLNRMRDKAAEKAAAKAKAEPEPEKVETPDVAGGLDEGAGAGDSEEGSE